MKENMLSNSLQQQINELYQQLTSLKEEKKRVNEEARRWAEKRDKIHDEIKNLRTEVASLKEKRDELNKKVKELKETREQAKTERKAKHEQILKLKEKMKVLLEKRPSRNMRDLQGEIESLEWKIQTTSLTVKDEQPLIEKVKTLEAQLIIHKQIEEIKNAIMTLQTEEKAFATKSEFSHEKLSELAQQSQKIHEKMLETMNKVHVLRTEADSMHQKFIETKQQATCFHEESMKLMNQITVFKQKLREIEEEKQSENQHKIVEELKKRAKEKVKRGEKLSWEEFKVLAQEGIDEKA
jgi:uncharacterized coiled-coil DUF342 family protein